MTSLQVTGSFKKLCSSSLRKPISTRTLTNSGNPPYLSVYDPLLLVIFYLEGFGDFSQFERGYQRMPYTTDDGFRLRHIVAFLVYS